MWYARVEELSRGSGWCEAAASIRGRGPKKQAKAKGGDQDVAQGKKPVVVDRSYFRMGSGSISTVARRPEGKGRRE